MITSNHKRHASKILLALLFSSTMSSVYATSFLPSTETLKCYGTKAALAGVFIAAFRFLSREGDNEPGRYDLEALMSGENISANLYYLVDDGIIGSKGKKPYVTVDKNNDRLLISSPAYPKGILGWLDYYKGSIIGALAITYIVNEFRLGHSLADIKATVLKKYTDLTGLQAAQVTTLNPLNII